MRPERRLSGQNARGGGSRSGSQAAFWRESDKSQGSGDRVPRLGSALFRKLFTRKGFRAYPINRQTVVYVENGRRMDISGEMLADGFQVYVASIVSWNDGRGGLIDEAERERITQNVKASLESQGMHVVLD
jgi:hypothetical protein